MRRLLYPTHLLLWPLFVSAQPASPLTPEQALKSFKIETGLQIELVAAEPLVIAPVAMAFDERGRLFVVENRGYPTGPGAGKPPAGMIALLEDSDGDGRFDKRTTFAHNLTFPNGIMPWRGGLLVTCAPDIIFLKDSDGDGRADLREVVLTGFDDSNTTQLRVSHPTLGPDNWVYVTSGLTGASKVRRPNATNPPIELRTDVRFRPDTWEFEAADGRGQFGMTFDDFGHRFHCMNRVHVQHVVLPSRYLRRNPALAFTETVQNVPETMVAEPLPGHGSAARIFPVSKNITTADSHAGTFTAACGVTIYRGTGLPDDYYGNVLACDPTGNLVHRDTLIPAGATFSARRASQTGELLASTDDWFRPVSLALGPEGALYVCDMYRKTIEHPIYLPGELRKHTDFESGKDKGRIYRISSAKKAASRNNTLFAKATTPELCRALNHPNGWQRDTAHRLLLERSDPAMTSILRSFFASGTKSSAPGRVFALHLLDRLAALDEPALLRALADAHSGVRENAAMLAESRAQSSPAIIEKLLSLADDPEPHVRFHSALSLGLTPISGTAATEALGKVALQGAADKWTRAAVLSSVSKRELPFARSCSTALLREGADPSARPGIIALAQEIGQLLGTAQIDATTDKKVTWLLGNVETVLPWQIAAFNGFLAASEKRAIRIDPKGYGASSLLPHQIGALESKARTLALDRAATSEIRQASIDLLGRLGSAGAENLLLQTLDPREPTPVQISAVRALGRSKGETVAASLLESSRWQSYSPPVREAVLDTIVTANRHLPALFTAIESGKIPAGVVNSNRRKQLLQNKDTVIRERAVTIFKSSGPGDRMKVFEDHKSVLAMTGASANGRDIFRKQCAVCHRLDQDGIPVGPDLFSMRNQSKETILLHIIVPEFEMMPGFANYLVETHDGRSLSGIIAAETPHAITLRRALNEEDSIARTNIASIASSGLSLMPQELEKNMTRQELADLLAYLKGE